MRKEEGEKRREKRLRKRGMGKYRRNRVGQGKSETNEGRRTCKKREKERVRREKKKE